MATIVRASVQQINNIVYPEGSVALQRITRTRVQLRLHLLNVKTSANDFTVPQTKPHGYSGNEKQAYTTRITFLVVGQELLVSGKRWKSEQNTE